jgi:hypothetical protein
MDAEKLRKLQAKAKGFKNFDKTPVTGVSRAVCPTCLQPLPTSGDHKHTQTKEEGIGGRGRRKEKGDLGRRRGGEEERRD